jgi:hypothetical protein
MRKIIPILLLNFCLFSCYSQKTNPDIIYFFPPPVKDILIKELQKRGTQNNTYMVLDKESEDVYIVYLSNPNSLGNFWVEHTNRAVFLQGKLIPLYFYSDEYFSFAEKGENVLKKLGKEEDIKKIINIRDNVFNVRFKLDGEIVK